MENRLTSLDKTMVASAGRKEDESARDVSALPIQAEDMKFTDQQTASVLGARPDDHSTEHPAQAPLQSRDAAAAGELPVEQKDLGFVDQQSAASVEDQESGHGHAAQDVGNPDLGRRDNMLGQAGDFPLDRNAPEAADAQGAVSIATKDAEKRFATNDAAFRDHWETTYGQSAGRYEDYDAAYRYGTEAGGGDRYRNYQWESAEPELRNTWEQDHPESTWEKVKDAVRYGIERVKSGMGLH